MSQKVVINRGIGSYGISREAVDWLRENGYSAGDECVLPGELYDDGSGPREEYGCGRWAGSYGDWVDRDDSGIVAVVEELGERANGDDATLEVVEVPDGVDWQVEEDETGYEHIAEKHRTWPQDTN